MKSFWKRTAAVLLVIALSLSAGCAAQPSAPAEQSGEASQASAGGSLSQDDPVTVTLWYYYTGETQNALNEAVTTFNQTVGRDNGVIVNAVAKGSLQELEEDVTDSAKGVINSEEMPNIFSCYADKAMELDELDALCDLNAYFTQEEQEEYVKGFIDDGIFDGRLLVLPIVKSTELLYINKTALDEFSAANPGAVTDDTLKTWEGLYGLSKAYYEWTDDATAEAWDGKGFMGIDELANFLIISNKQLGIDLLDGDTATVNFDEAVLKKIFTLYYSAMSLGYFDEVSKFRSDDVKSGDLAAYVGASSSAAYFPTFIEVDNQESEIELQAAAYPLFEGGEPFTIQQGAGMAVAKADSAAEEASCIFLKWFTDVQQNMDFALLSGYLPVKQAAYSAEEVDKALAFLEEDESAGSDNVKKVYGIALETVVDGKPYAAKPFVGSYGVRSMLKSSLAEAGAAGKEEAASFKAQGSTAEEILASLDPDAKFAAWFEDVKTELDDMGVAYNIS